MPLMVAVIANVGSPTLAMVASLIVIVLVMLAMIAYCGAGITSRAPLTFDPDVAAAAILPPALLPDVAGTLALVIAVTPIPAIAVSDPAAFHPDKAGPNVDDDRARRRWLLFDLDNRYGCCNVALRAHDAASQGRERCRKREATKCVFE